MSTALTHTRLDEGFACRSARYLASRGYQPPAIRAALIEHLEVSNAVADDIVSAIAA